jgi:hypothetical protein
MNGPRIRPAEEEPDQGSQCRADDGELAGTDALRAQQAGGEIDRHRQHRQQAQHDQHHRPEPLEIPDEGDQHHAREHQRDAGQRRQHGAEQAEQDQHGGDDVKRNGPVHELTRSANAGKVTRRC